MINIMIDIMVLLIMIILMVTMFKIMMINVKIMMFMEDFSNINLFSGQYSLKQLRVVCARCHLQDDDLDHKVGNQ